MISLSGLALAGAALAAATPAAPATPPGRRLKVLVAGGHPDDPETGAGGTMARYAAAGHEVVALYFTTGEAGIDGQAPDQAAAIRRAEAQRACGILQARAVFAGQIDGASRVDPAAYAAMHEILRREDPDVIFTHWPLDTHRDHRHCTMLVLDSWFASGRRVPLYYYEVMTGSQTQGFAPTDYVDISEVVARKHEACFVHVSQKVSEWYEHDHGRMEVFRGMEAGCRHAEAFVRHDTGPAGRLPGAAG